MSPFGKPEATAADRAKEDRRFAFGKPGGSSRTGG
jgi:hypothetical protein